MDTADRIEPTLSQKARKDGAPTVWLGIGGAPGPSKWINDHLDRRSFDWQDGYGAFSIGISQLENTIGYINNQERHHAKMNFPQELEKMLKRHGIKLYRGPRD